MYLKIGFTLGLFIFGIIISFAQEDKNKQIYKRLNSLATNISRELVIDIDYKGNLTSRMLNKLAKKASESDLMALTRHSSPNVRFYAIYLLTQNFDSIPYLDLAQHFLYDLDSVEVAEWTTLSHGPALKQFNKQVLGELALQMLGTSSYTGFIPRNSFKCQPYTWANPAQLKAIDSLLVCNPNELIQTRDVLSYNASIPAHYPCIRSLVEHYDKPEALYALAKFQKDSDVNLILQEVIRTGAIWVLKAFQHPTFLTFLASTSLITIPLTYMQI
ncbi:MAG: hypothetical protein HC880_21065 [Bacteroidia bacterium]|nr:hypothetical protein [Bacteroidia bacterium]